MQLVITEKPSVAKSIAEVLHATEHKNGYLQGNGYLVSWCVGHLVELASADIYREEWRKWAYETLPIIPDVWQYQVKENTRKQYESKADYDKAVLKTLDGRDIDLIVLAGFLSILGEDLVSKYNNRIINVHPSLIPLFCGDGFYGKKVHTAVLNSGMKVTGATVHFVNEITDGGAIILQKAVPIEQGDNEDILQYRVMRQAEWEILPKAVSLFCEGRIKINGNKTEII